MFKYITSYIQKPFKDSSDLHCTDQVSFSLRKVDDLPKIIHPVFIEPCF